GERFDLPYDDARHDDDFFDRRMRRHGGDQLAVVESDPAVAAERIGSHMQNPHAHCSMTSRAQLRMRVEVPSGRSWAHAASGTLKPGFLPALTHSGSGRRGLSAKCLLQRCFSNMSSGAI